MTIFQPFFLGNIVQENIFDEILEQKNAFLGYKNKQFRKSKNWPFPKVVNPWFLVQKRPFFQDLYLVNIGQQNVFYDNLERKNAFLGYKNKNFKKSKNWHFSKGVNPWFLSKNVHCSTFFFFSNVGHQNVFYDILERKNQFLDCKNKKLKPSKNWLFSKGLNPWLWYKNVHFSNFFFFTKYRPGTCLLLYSRAKKRLSRL